MVPVGILGCCRCPENRQSSILDLFFSLFCTCAFVPVHPVVESSTSRLFRTNKRHQTTNDNAASLNVFFMYTVWMESLNVGEKHVIQMLGYIPFPKKIKYMIHSHLSLVGCCKIILKMNFKKCIKSQNELTFKQSV